MIRANRFDMRNYTLFYFFN